MQDAAGPESLTPVGDFLIGRVVRMLRLLLCVEVVEVPEELVEAVVGRKELVPIAEVVLAELPGDVALLLERRGDRRIVLMETDRRSGKPDLGESRAVHALPRDERSTTRRAGLLAVVVGELHTLVGDAIDVGRAVPHQPVAVTAQVGDADVVSPEDEDVGLSVRHDGTSFDRPVGTVTLASATPARAVGPTSDATTRDDHNRRL